MWQEQHLYRFFFLPSSFIHKMNTAEFKSATFPNAGSRHLLDDSVMEPHTPSRGQAESSTLSSGISIGKTGTLLTGHPDMITISLFGCTLHMNACVGFKLFSLQKKQTPSVVTTTLSIRFLHRDAWVFNASLCRQSHSCDLGCNSCTNKNPCS